MVPSRLELMKPMRREMQVTTERVRDRLRLVVIIKAGEITPAWIAPQFDETGADHDATAEPAKQPDDKQRRPAFRKWAAVNEWTKKDRYEPGFEQLDFPAVAVPNLANVHDRHVHRPENREENGVGVAGENNKRETETEPCKDQQRVIGGSEPKQRRHAQDAGHVRTKPRSA